MCFLSGCKFLSRYLLPIMSLQRWVLPQHSLPLLLHVEYLHECKWHRHLDSVQRLPDRVRHEARQCHHQRHCNNNSCREQNLLPIQNEARPFLAEHRCCLSPDPHEGSPVQDRRCLREHPRRPACGRCKRRLHRDNSLNHAVHLLRHDDLQFNANHAVPPLPAQAQRWRSPLPYAHIRHHDLHESR